MGLWSWIRGIGGNPDEEAALREEFGGDDPGEAAERYIADAGYGTTGPYPGLADADAADVAEADLEETKRPPDPAP
jgi:hypothetical protein